MFLLHLFLLLLPYQVISQQDLTSCLLRHGASLRMDSTSINALSIDEKRNLVLDLMGRSSVDYNRKINLLQKTNDELVIMCAPELPAGAISSGLYHMKYEPQCEQSGKAECVCFFFLFVSFCFFLFFLFFLLLLLLLALSPPCFSFFLSSSCFQLV